jgi:hypothetical protein
MDKITKSTSIKFLEVNMKKIFFGLIPLIIFIMGCDNDTTGNGGYVIGDRGPAGGIIFYAKDSTSAGWQYLEAAPVDASGNYEWASSGKTTLELGNTQTGIGTGKANTAAILAADSDAPAAKACDDYTLNGYNDWFLPSKDELNEMYRQRTVVGGFAESVYLSSSEHHDDQSWSHGFGDTPADWANGTQKGNYKSNKNKVRPIRAF